jgi:hypothetical protein
MAGSEALNPPSGIGARRRRAVWLWPGLGWAGRARELGAGWGYPWRLSGCPGLLYSSSCRPGSRLAAVTASVGDEQDDRTVEFGWGQLGALTTPTAAAACRRVTREMVVAGAGRTEGRVERKRGTGTSTVGVVLRGRGDAGGALTAAVTSGLVGGIECG